MYFFLSSLLCCRILEKNKMHKNCNKRLPLLVRIVICLPANLVHPLCKFFLSSILSEGPSNDKKNVMTGKLLNTANGSLKPDGATNEENSSDKRLFQIMFSYILTISKFLGLL